MPYVEIKVEDANYVGTLVGPDCKYGTLASEASSRKAVLLAKQGNYVEFMVPQTTNAFVIRFSKTNQFGSRPECIFSTVKFVWWTTWSSVGPWYSILTGNEVGVFGRWGSPLQNVGLYDFAIFGSTCIWNDGVADSRTGAVFSNTIFQNLWIEHTKVGIEMKEKAFWRGLVDLTK